MADGRWQVAETSVGADTHTPAAGGSRTDGRFAVGTLVEILGIVLCLGGSGRGRWVWVAEGWG